MIASSVLALALIIRPAGGAGAARDTQTVADCSGLTGVLVLALQPTHPPRLLESGLVDDSPPKRVSRADTAALYKAHRQLMLWIGCNQHKVPAVDAECLAQEVFLAYFEGLGHVRSARHWLVGAMVHVSQEYWRQRGRLAPLPPDIDERVDEASLDLARKVEERVTLHEVLALLGERCRSLLWSHYCEDVSLAELASRRQTTAKTIKTALHRCLVKLRLKYHEVT